jgi:hypothetical protein
LARYSPGLGPIVKRVSSKQRAQDDESDIRRNITAQAVGQSAGMVPVLSNFGGDRMQSWTATQLSGITDQHPNHYHFQIV